MGTEVKYSQVWSEEAKRVQSLEADVREEVKEDVQKMKRLIYGCSSFFFSDIRFLRAASIS